MTLPTQERKRPTVELGSRSIDLIVVFLLSLGVLTIVNRVLTGSTQDLQNLSRGIIQYWSIPFGLLIKLFQAISAERKRLEESIDEIRELASNNRATAESVRVQLEFLSQQQLAFSNTVNSSIIQLEKKLIRLDAKTAVSSQLAQHEHRLSELTDRFNLYLSENK